MTTEPILEQDRLIRPGVALPLILLHARNLRDLADRSGVDPLIVRALDGIAEDLAGVVEQLAAVAA